MAPLSPQIYIFDLVNVVLVSSITPNVVINPWTSAWVNESIWTVLGQSLPGMSLFYINFLMVVSFTGFFFELLQIFRCVCGRRRCLCFGGV